MDRKEETLEDLNTLYDELSCVEEELHGAKWNASRQLIDKIIKLNKRLRKRDHTFEFTKNEIIAYCAFHNGPLTREELLHQLAIFEMKEHLPTQKVRFHRLIEDGTLLEFGKVKYRKTVYTAGIIGIKHASNVTKKLGSKPAERANLISKSYFLERKL